MEYIIVKYIRLSIEEEKLESCSIETQGLIIDEYIKEMDIPSYKVIEIVDNGYSGTNLARPGIRRLLDMVSRQEVHCVIVKDFSRLSRNILEGEHLVKQVFPVGFVRFISVSDGFDSVDHTRDAGGLFVSFKLLAAEEYSKDISAKTKAAVAEQIKQGAYIKGDCIYGYKKVSNNKMDFDPEAAPTVRRIFDLYLDGAKAKDICKILYESKVPTPNEHKRKTPDHQITCVWRETTVLNILNREDYTGMYIGGKSAINHLGKRALLPKELQTRIPDHHPAIIPKEIFEKAVKQLIANRIKPNSKQPQQTPNKPRHLLHGIVYCGHCGHKLRYIPKTTPVFCCFYAKNAPNEDCHKLSVVAEDLEGWVYEATVEKAKRVADASEREVLLVDGHDAGISEKMRLYEALVDEKITVVEYENQTKALEDRMARIGVKKPSGADAMTWAKDVLATKEMSNELYLRCIHKIMLTKNSEPKIRWNEY